MYRKQEYNVEYEAVNKNGQREFKTISVNALDFEVSRFVARKELQKRGYTEICIGDSFWSMDNFG